MQRKTNAKKAFEILRENLADLDDRERLELLSNCTFGNEELDLIPRTREIAKAIGEPEYNTGLPCKRNHLSNRETESGKCIACVQQLKEEYKPYRRLNSIERRRLFLSADGSFTKSDIDIMLVTQDSQCKYCKADFEFTGYHIDHIMPLSKGGSNWHSNLQLLCPTCNLRKSGKLPQDFEREIGYVRDEQM